MYKFIFIIILVEVLFLGSCTLILEEDIQNQIVLLNSPGDGFETYMSSQTFWWESVNGAMSYNLQIVNPGFENPNFLLLDTNLTKTKFYYSLNPGNYEWRVMAYNSAYTTQYSKRSLTITETPDLTGQVIVIKTPGNNLQTNISALFFSWYSIAQANYYQIEIKSPDWNGSTIIGPLKTNEDTITIKLDEDSYEWGVQAFNDLSNSLISKRAFTVDTTRPRIPELNLPLDESLFPTGIVVFSWQRPDESGTTISDSLIIASDSTFESSTVIVKLFTSNTQYSTDMDVEGIYYWKVQSFDAAGNRSESSLIRSIIISNEK